ncbi:MAG TPA: ABC transporter substrate-binding protein, partial [Devosia sp.]|nr:ABC transporter substrate-binding protein [Devosia sp.]
MTVLTRGVSRRGVIKTGVAGILGAGVMPTILSRNAFAQEYCNAPGDTAVFGFNVPQTGSYAEEGLEQLKGYELAVKHINGEGDGGIMNTLKPLTLKGNGVLGKKVSYVTGDTQTNTDVARDGARRMIERDRAIMVTGSVTSGEAIAVQSLCQEMGVIYMAGLTHSNDTTGKDKRRYGFRHFFNAYQSGVAIAPFLAQQYGKERRAYHLTADYTWGWTQEESIKNATEALGWETVAAVRTPLG